eukprot:GSMAST32.ASY1.ANO1.18.1 assembled CDS
MDDAISMDARVGAWEVGERIGRGGFGMVYKGINPTTKEACAIKRIPLTGLSADSLACAESEIDLLKNLSHANIVEYRADIVKQFGTFTETLAVVYITQVMRGLEYLHSQGVIHRDIKGANILTTKSGVVKLADFGSSKDMISNDLDVVGTPFWMAPEIVQMSGLTTSCDIWSLGCTLIELLTGKPPYFMRNHLAHTQGKRHQVNLARRAAKEARDNPAQPQPLGISKQRDSETKQRSLVFEIAYPEIEEGVQPRHRFMSPYEQRIEPPDKNFQYLLFAASPYETIAFKVPNMEVDKNKDKFLTNWDPNTKTFTLQLYFKNERTQVKQASSGRVKLIAKERDCAY